MCARNLWCHVLLSLRERIACRAGAQCRREGGEFDQAKPTATIGSRRLVRSGEESIPRATIGCDGPVPRSTSQTKVRDWLPYDVSFIFTIIGSMLLLDAIWWWTLARQTDNGTARVVLGIFMCAQM